MNGKGFYIALALCLMAIGAAAYVAANNSPGAMTAVSSGGGGLSVSDEGVSGWDNGGAEQADKTVSGVTDTQQASSQPDSAPGSAASNTAPNAAAGNSASAAAGAAAPTLYVMPVNGSIITAYSDDKPVYDKTMDDYRAHDGIDIAANAGTPVKACAAGVVTDVVSDDMYGETVTVKHGGGIVSVYSCLSAAVSVKKGQAVEAGDVVGTVGQTAKCEIALVPHLHFAMLNDNRYVSPLAAMGKG
jgi:murein DD-endopeptidase MepM/ murein hydrolase activator NlpD